MITFALIMLRGEEKVENVIKEMTNMGEEKERWERRRYGVCACACAVCLCVCVSVCVRQSVNVCGCECVYVL